ncbi:MAG: DUF1361 domain-containing protein [Bacteroidota bacterium]
MKALTRLKFSISQQLLLFISVMSCIRMIRLQDTGILFLAWNLFLGWLPLFFIRQIALFSSKKWQYGIFGLSLLFLPNSIYIFTDLIHLKKDLPAPLWFDLILFLAFALMGFVYFAKTMREMMVFIAPKMNILQAKMTELGLVMISSFGVYLGRYLRLNSWDLFSNPFAIFREIRQEFSNGKGMEMFQITLVFGVFMFILNKAAQKRWDN